MGTVCVGMLNVLAEKYSVNSLSDVVKLIVIVKDLLDMSFSSF